MYLHNLVIVASEAGAHEEEPYKHHQQYMVGVTVMIIFTLLMSLTLMFQKDR